MSAQTALTNTTVVPLQVTGVLKEWVEAADLEPYRQLGGRKIVELS
jgi:hypothetical protein